MTGRGEGMSERERCPRIVTMRRWMRRCISDISDARYWFRHRTYDKYHVIRCHGLKPGYYDKDVQLLHAVMGLLVDYVEGEAAWMHAMGENSPRFRRHCRLRRIFPWIKFRSREDGLAHLDWAMGLVYDETHGTYPDEEHYGKPTRQAESAKAKKEIYLWWTDSRPKRPDYNQGFHDLCERRRDGEVIEDSAFSAEAMRSAATQEAYDAEDDAMLTRVIDLRHGMWT